MKWPGLRFTMRRMMAIVAVVAMLLAASLWAFDRYWSAPRSWTYPVADLLPNTPGVGLQSDIGAFAERLKSAVTPDVWWSSRRNVVPFFLSGSLMVQHNARGHEQVAAWISEQRSRAGKPTKVTGLSTLRISTATSPPPIPRPPAR